MNGNKPAASAAARIVVDLKPQRVNPTTATTRPTATGSSAPSGRVQNANPPNTPHRKNCQVAGWRTARTPNNNDVVSCGYDAQGHSTSESRTGANAYSSSYTVDGTGLQTAQDGTSPGCDVRGATLCHGMNAPGSHL